MSKQTAVEWLLFELSKNGLLPDGIPDDIHNQAKAMEREQHDKFNDFLEKEKQFKISDLKTIERIQWYYNTYFNQTYGGDK
jgi:hypothetical protein